VPFLRGSHFRWNDVSIRSSHEAPRVPGSIEGAYGGCPRFGENLEAGDTFLLINFDSKVVEAVAFSDFSQIGILLA
jgi:hypothetical protein